MSDPVVTNILKTGAAVYYAPVGEAEPDETTVEYGAAWGGNWARIGYTKEPLAMAYESEEVDIEVEEALASVRRHRIKETAMFETVMSELTAAYLQLAAGGQGTVSTTPAGAAQKAFEEITVGDEAQLDEQAWGFEGLFVDSDGEDQPVRVFVYKATAKVNGNLEFSKKSDDYVGLPLQVNALADVDNSNQLFKFQRCTADATA